MNLISRIKLIFSNKYFLLIFSQLVIIYSAVVNRLPLGYIVSGGDASQTINWSKMIQSGNYLWANSTSEGNFNSNYCYGLYNYAINFLNSILKLSLQNQASLLILLFLIASFWSFYLSLRFFDTAESGISDWVKILFALSYTFNIYTLRYFAGMWGYSQPFLFLYPLIPIFFALTYRYFTDLNRKSALQLLPFLVVIFFLSNISNANLAFFIAQCILLLILIVLIYIFNRDRLQIQKYLKYALLYAGLLLLSTSWSVIPQIQEMLRLSGSFATGTALFDLRSWILWQAASVPTVYFLGDIINNPTNLKLLTFFAGGLFFSLTLLLGFQKKITKQEKIFLLLLLVCIFLLNKGAGIINPGIIWSIFKNPILGSLRSYDKAAIFMPFLILLPIVLIFPRQTKPLKLIIVLAIFVSFLSAIPFVKGNIQTFYSEAHLKGQNYLTAENSSLVKIPNDYREIADQLNQEKLLDRIVSGPYSVINSVGWVNLPKWKLIGVDPTVQLFNKPTTQMNAFSIFGDWNYGKLWSRQSPEDSNWFLPFLGLMNGRYFIYHTDVDPKFIAQTSDKIKDYVNKGFITEVKKNDYFTLYKIADQFYLPHIYTPTKIIISKLSVSDLPTVINKSITDNRQVLYFNKDGVLDKLLADMPTKVDSPPTVEYKEISPTRFRVRVHKATSDFPLVFSESYNDSWRLYPENYKKSIDKTSDQQVAGNSTDQATTAELSDFINQGLISNLGSNFVSKNFKGTIQNDNLPNGSVFETWFRKPLSAGYAHIPANGYANSWLINPGKFCQQYSCVKNSDGSYDFELVMEFWPQRLYYIFGFVTLLTLATSLGFLLRNIIRKNNGKS